MTDASAYSAEAQRARAVRLNNRTVFGLVSFLMLLPTALLAASLRPAPAAALLVGAAGVLALSLYRAPAAEPHVLDLPVESGRLALSIAVAALILVCGGALHIFFAPYDWRIRDAVLVDLVRNGFPLIYDVGGAEYLLRAPLGMYMLPALVGKAFGLTAAHAALLAQNSILLGAIFYLVGKIGRGWAHVGVMILSAPFALFGLLLWALIGATPDWSHIVNFSLDSWHPYFQYSSAITQFFWVPNHALPGWWLAALMILQTRDEIDLPTVAAGVGGAMFWSPLVVLPVALWVVLLAVWNLRASLTSPRIWAAALLGLCFLPSALYMVVGASEIAYGVTAAKEYFALLYVLFMATQIWQPAFVVAHRARVPGRLYALFAFSAVMLALLPFVNFGPSNDLVMRGSIPALFVVAFVFGWVALDSGLSWKGRAFAILLIAGCSASGIVEFSRAFHEPTYEISDCSLFEATYALGGVGIPANYAAERNAIPRWLMNLDAAPHRALEDRRCWSDTDRRRQFDALP